MIDCPRGDIRDQLPDLLHDRLDAGARQIVEAHVAGCAECSSELDLLRTVRGADLHATPAMDVEAIVRRVRGAGTLATAPLRFDRRRRVPARALSLAAALLLLVLGTVSVLYLGGSNGTTGADQPVLAANGDPRNVGDAHLVFASQGGLFVGTVADMDESELESMLQFLPALDPLPDEEPPLLIHGFSTGEG